MATADHAALLLDKRFNTADPRRDPVLLLVDEVRYACVVGWSVGQSFVFRVKLDFGPQYCVCTNWRRNVDYLFLFDADGNWVSWAENQNVVHLILCLNCSCLCCCRFDVMLKQSVPLLLRCCLVVHVVTITRLLFDSF